MMNHYQFAFFLPLNSTLSYEGVVEEAGLEAPKSSSFYREGLEDIVFWRDYFEKEGRYVFQKGVMPNGHYCFLLMEDDKDNESYHFETVCVLNVNTEEVDLSKPINGLSLMTDLGALEGDALDKLMRKVNKDEIELYLKEYKFLKKC